MTTLRRVLVAGGTGGTGRQIVRRLCLLGIPTRILTRDPRHAGDLGPVAAVRDRSSFPLPGANGDAS